MAGFRYDRGPLGRFADRHFPERGLRRRQAALQSFLFDKTVQTRGFQRAAERFSASYDLLAGDRKRRGYLRNLSGTGDMHLTETALSDARETARDAARNDPIVRGLLQSYAEGIVGSELGIEARSSDENWNNAREQLWKERMLDVPCDVTGRFNFIQSVFLAVLSFARDGDFFVVFGDDGAWLVEGEQVGTPFGQKVDGEYFRVFNGVATALPHGRVIGYYVGRPNKWGYIEPSNYAKYTADLVHHVFDPDRISYTRGEPLLTPSIEWFDKFGRYADAELVTSCVQACQGVAVKKKSPESVLPSPTTLGASDDYNTDDGLKRFVMSPAMVWNLEPGEDVTNIGATRPTSVFGEFMNKCLTIAGRAAGMPLMLITQDLSGATFMNARIAAQMAQERWRKVQAFVVRPLASRWWLWQTQREIESGELAPAPDDWARHEVMCRRWPYVDPEKEAKADKLEIENGTTSRTAICARKGVDYRELVRQRVREQEIEDEEGLVVTAVNDGDDNPPAGDSDAGGEAAESEETDGDE